MVELYIEENKMSDFKKLWLYPDEENRIENIKKSGRISWKTLEDQLSGKTQNEYHFSST